MQNATKVSIYEVHRYFWKMNSIEPLPASAIALFFYLLNQANQSYWQMPMKCSTVRIANSLMCSQQTVIEARDKLRLRGLLSFTKGAAKKLIPTYVIELNPKKWKLVSQIEFKVGFTESPEDKKNLSPYQGNENEKMEKIESTLLADTAWQSRVSGLITGGAAPVESEVREYIALFFRYLRCTGCIPGTLKDCRAYFVNWFVKQYKEKNNGKQKQHPSTSIRRKDTDVKTFDACNYDEPF